jgi:hypothetical protein
VPQKWTEDPPLGRWVADQRRYKKQLDRGEPSQGMTAARMAKLEALGFAWELSAAELSKQCSKARRGNAGWDAQLDKLKAYKRSHGDCNVPYGWAEDPPLARWVNTQRKRKKQLDRGGPGQAMTAARATKLEAIGFAWELSAVERSKQCSKASRGDVGWDAQLAELKNYKRKHGDCNVPRSWAEDPRLSCWVMTQRARKKQLDRGDPGLQIAAERVAKLDELGFAWRIYGVRA